MKKSYLLLIGLLISLFVNSQHVYVNPNIGLIKNNYTNSNSRITGNISDNYLFDDMDVLAAFLIGVEFESNLIIETGFQYHDSWIRYHLNYYPELSNGGGATKTFGEGYFCIPINAKYGIDLGIKNLKLIPYAGITYSIHNIQTSPYMILYDVEYEPFVPNSMDFPTPIDTTAIITAFRTSNNNLLVNAGASIEYRIIKNLIFTLSGNYTIGFTGINRLDIEVFYEENYDSGEIIYKGNKFYLSFGIKIPIGLK